MKQIDEIEIRTYAEKENVRKCQSEAKHVVPSSLTMFFINTRDSDFEMVASRVACLVAMLYKITRKVTGR